MWHKNHIGPGEVGSLGFVPDHPDQACLDRPVQMHLVLDASFAVLPLLDDAIDGRSAFKCLLGFPATVFRKVQEIEHKPCSNQTYFPWQGFHRFSNVVDLLCRKSLPWVKTAFLSLLFKPPYDFSCLRWPRFHGHFNCLVSRLRQRLPAGPSTGASSLFPRDTHHCSIHGTSRPSIPQRSTAASYSGRSRTADHSSSWFP